MSEAVSRGDTSRRDDLNSAKAEKKLPDLKGCETPRRALGDLKNVFATPVNSAMKRKAPEKSQSSFNVLSEESPVDEEKDEAFAPEIQSAVETEAVDVDDDDDVVESFNYKEHIETYEEIFPTPDQRIDVSNLLRNVQIDDRFLRTIFSELLDGDDLKLLNERNPLTNEDCDKVLTDILIGGTNN